MWKVLNQTLKRDKYIHLGLENLNPFFVIWRLWFDTWLVEGFSCAEKTTGA